jgi:hypothetical protein
VLVEHVVVELLLDVGLADPWAVGHPELVQVGAVPAGEPVVDGGSELTEGVGAGGGEDPPRSGPVVFAAASNEVDLDGQPGAAHGAMLPDRLCFRRCHPVVAELRRRLMPYFDTLGDRGSQS